MKNDLLFLEKETETFWQKVKVFLPIELIGFFYGLGLWIFVLSRRLEVKGWDKKKLDPKEKPIILYGNHPSILEVVALPFRFFPWYLFSPRFVPISLPNRKYYDKWWFKISGVRQFCLRVGDNPRTLKKAIRLINERKIDILIVQPEGTRTCNFERKDLLITNSGEEIGKFQLGIRRLFLETDCKIIPFYTRGGDRIFLNKPKKLTDKIPRIWRKATVVVGEELPDVKSFGKKGVIKYLEKSLLELANK